MILRKSHHFSVKSTFSLKRWTICCSLVHITKKIFCQINSLASLVISLLSKNDTFTKISPKIAEIYSTHFVMCTLHSVEKQEIHCHANFWRRDCISTVLEVTSIFVLFSAKLINLAEKAGKSFSLYLSRNFIMPI